MNDSSPTYNEIDGYIAELTEAEREELDTADAAIELAFLFHDAREARRLTQTEAAQRAGLRQQAVSRFEQPDMSLANTKIETLRKYLAALGYSVQIIIRDLKSGLATTDVSLPPRPQQTIFYIERAPWCQWQRGATTAKTPIRLGEFNLANVGAPLVYKDIMAQKLFPGQANTARSSDLSINLLGGPQEPMESSHA